MPVSQLGPNLSLKTHSGLTSHTPRGGHKASRVPVIYRPLHLLTHHGAYVDCVHIHTSNEVVEGALTMHQASRRRRRLSGRSDRHGSRLSRDPGSSFIQPRGGHHLHVMHCVAADTCAINLGRHNHLGHDHGYLVLSVLWPYAAQDW